MKSAIVKTVGRAKRFTISTGMTCGSAEAENRTYKLIVGRTGRRWLVAIQPDEADNTYVEGGPNSEGFAGRTLSFKLEDGTTLDLQGPWHSNAESLFADTGYDCRDKYMTQGIIGLERESDYRKGDLYRGILHFDKEPVCGRYDRIEQLAQGFANKLGKPVFYSMKSAGGGTSSMKQPMKI